MTDALITAIVFFGIYMLIKCFTDYLLKRRIIISGHIDKAAILEPLQSKEENYYPTLKWGLVSFFAGIGLLVIAYFMNNQNPDWIYGTGSYAAIGIELISISLGFLIYFIFTRKKPS
jgi:hypothetical protein